MSQNIWCSPPASSPTNRLLRRSPVDPLCGATQDRQARIRNSLVELGRIPLAQRLHQVLACRHADLWGQTIMLGAVERGVVTIDASVVRYPTLEPASPGAVGETLAP